MSDKARGLRSRELARAAGVSTDTLRHYERVGVLAEAPRTPSGYRVYPPDSLERVNMIRHSIGLGFTLAELAKILRTRDRGGTPCKEVLGLLEGKLDSLEKHIAELRNLQKHMKGIVGDWRSKLGQTEPHKRAYLLHSLTPTPTSAQRNGNLQRRRNQP